MLSLFLNLWSSRGCLSGEKLIADKTDTYEARLVSKLTAALSALDLVVEVLFFLDSILTDIKLI